MYNWDIKCANKLKMCTKNMNANHVLLIQYNQQIFITIKCQTFL